MAGFHEYTLYDATGLAALIRKGKITAAEVLDATIERLEAVNPHLNAVVQTTLDEARRALGDAPSDRPFVGVPFLFKDLLQAYAGVPMRCGSAALKNYVPSRHSEVVRRFLEAGVLPLGRTNVPELGLLATTEPLAYGPTRNPWNRECSAGGSSGGSAAAVAARIVPMAGGNDGGGSIRVPAAWCGLFGLKPSRGRVPAGPDFAEVWDGAVCEHVLTRSVRDSAAMLDALRGPDPGAPYTAFPPKGSYARAAEEDPPRLRIGFTTRSPLGTPVDRVCRQAVNAAAQHLSDLGHEVEEADPEVDGSALAHAFLTMYFGQTAAQLRLLAEQLGGRLERSRLEDLTRVIARLGRALSAEDYCYARQYWNTAGRAMAAYHQRYQLYLTPTVAREAPPLGEMRPAGWEALKMNLLRLPGAARLALRMGMPDRVADRIFGYAPFTQLANLTGQPAMNVPLHWSAAGMPIGVQFVAPIGEEALLFRLAGQLERAHPWAHHLPPGLS